jgi:hypothetical protein
MKASFFGGSKMLPSLIDVFGRVSDPRAKKGQRYALPGLLSVVFLALAGGANSLRQIAVWSRAQSPGFGKRLGFRRGKMPSYGGIRSLLVDLNVAELEGALCYLTEAARHQKRSRPHLSGMSIDGKTVRGSGSEEMPALQLLSAVAHGSKWVLAQEAIPPGESEQAAVQGFLEDLDLEGYVVTLDALHTQKDIAETIVKKGGIISSV